MREVWILCSKPSELYHSLLSLDTEYINIQLRYLFIFTSETSSPSETDPWFKYQYCLQIALIYSICTVTACLSNTTT